MKKLAVFLITILMVISTGAVAQTNEWVQACPQSGNSTNGYLLDQVGNSIGAQYGNSVTHYTAWIDVAGADSIQMAIDAPDTMKIDSIKFIYAMRTAGNVDTLTVTDGVAYPQVAIPGFTCTSSTGQLKFITGLATMARMRILPKWLRIWIKFSSTGNHYTSGTVGSYVVGIERFKLYVKLFK